MDSVSAHSQEIIGRADALARGLKRYFTGVPCRHEHVTYRYVTSRECVECAFLRTSLEMSKERKATWQKANRERRLDQKRAWNAANPGRRKEHDLAQRAANPNRDSDRKRARRAANPELLRSIDRNWASSNRDSISAKNQNRRGRKRAAEGCHTTADIVRIIVAQNYKCAFCQACVKDHRHVDHIIPLALGGSNWPKNLQILCPTCNCRKSSKDPIDFAQENGRLL